MPRPRRIAVGGVVYHVTNRGSRKGPLFETRDDYIAFERIVTETREQSPMRIVAYCLMWNHWHFLLWPELDRQLSAFMKGLTETHAMRWRRNSGTAGEGAVYQSRFVSKAINDHQHLLTCWRYIERNPVEAGIVARAQDWPWSSAAPRLQEPRPFVLDPGPCERPREWLDLVNDELCAPILPPLIQT
jgi:putative transposase